MAGFFLQIGRISERAPGGVAGFFGAHASGNVLRDLLVEVELDLGI
jgi:hypothetical protein